MAVPIAVAFGAALRSKRLLRSLAGEEKSYLNTCLEIEGMDLLASLGLGTALPEQATRLTCHPGIIRLLDGSGSSNEKEEEKYEKFK